MAPRALISAFRPITSAISPVARRTLSTTPRMAIKEDGNRTPEELEQKKQEQLKEQQQGKGRWREDLASSGESNIAADKQKVSDHGSHIKELQEEGKKKGEKGDFDTPPTPYSCPKLKGAERAPNAVSVASSAMRRQSSANNAGAWACSAQPRARKKKVVTRYNVAPMREDVLDEKPSSRRGSSSTAKSEPSDSETSLQTVPSSTASSEVDIFSSEAERAIATIRYQYSVPQLYQPSRIQGDALDMAFLQHFVELNQTSRSYSPEIPWLTHLPVIHSKAIKPAVKLSIRAASMAFFAKIHHDPAILVDSYRWYTVSLTAQRLSLGRLNGPGRIPDEEEILVPIVLGLYEVYAGTTSDSVLHHVAAACEIIKMRGPENCNSGIVWPMFKAMRVSDAQKALVLNKPSIFASPDWMTLPFANMPRNAHHDLADIMLMVPECTSLCGISGSLRTFFNTPFPLDVDLQPCRERTEELMAGLNAWAAAYPYLAKPSSGLQIVEANMANLSVSGAKPAFEGSKNIILPESFIALTIATYEAVHLTLLLLLNKLNTQDPRSQDASPTTASPDSSSPFNLALLDQAVNSAEVILQTARHLEGTKTVGFDFIRSVTPIVVVAILGPTEELTDNARTMLKRWGEKRGMNGLVGAWMHLLPTTRKWAHSSGIAMVDARRAAFQGVGDAKSPPIRLPRCAASGYPPGHSTAEQRPV
ncbi:hypothetical protein OPT61_g3560 [Boeremia exigua]|uniref:Uncharacterized protein n=1 Tax=Boeremia exigua TaxID=749465 RepID=A0ACC2IHL5_9PLEO|nr:hypothetical protein OPT61_g3560 [Boeremia exigua]